MIDNALEERIAAKVKELGQERRRPEQYRLANEIRELVNERTDEQVERMERERGLR